MAQHATGGTHAWSRRGDALGDEAWTATGQLKALAPNLNLSRWEVAVALPAGDAWFVHNRP
ncbi:hypothetical protein [Micromonospora sp. NPDC006431]|uniref:hypothetical protein n=1 Tax=Micromonospora sp. NPDC006431 TaxID=3364235 RepID=UPI00367EE804